MSHSQFKLFRGKQESISDIKQQIESFVSVNKVSARSIGIEFLEHSGEFFISLGYSKNGDYSPISINMVNFGKINLDDLAGLEKKMSDAAVAQKNVICHELCIPAKDEFMMIFMCSK